MDFFRSADDFSCELVVYELFTAAAWIISLVYLFPFLVLLKFSKSVRDRWYAWFYVKICLPRLRSATSKMRLFAFSRLVDDRGRVGEDRLEFLEITMGGGANLWFYPTNTRLTVVDMNGRFTRYFEAQQHNFTHIALRRIVTASPENMRELDDNTFDVVVCTYTLCYVKDLRSALNEIWRVLKPGGKYLFLEHIPYPTSSTVFTLQRFAAPLWKLYFSGCHLTRRTDEEIRKTGFTEVEHHSFVPDEMWLFARRQFVGVATK